MASGAQVSEEGGGVGGGEFEVESSKQATGETGEVGGGEIGEASADQVAGETGGVGGGKIGEIDDIKNQLTVEAGRVDGEIGAAPANQVTGKAAALGGEIKVLSANKVTGETGGLDGETKVLSANQFTGYSVGAGGEILVAAPNQVTGEPVGVNGKNGMTSETGGMGGEIRVTSMNLISRELDDLGCESRLAFANYMTGEAEDFENGVASANKVNGEPGGGGGEILLASANQVNGEPGGESIEIEVAFGNQVNGKPGGGGGESRVASADKANGEPGGWDEESTVASAIKVNGEQGGGGGESRVTSVSKVNQEPGGGGGENGVPSANQVIGEAGGGGGEMRVASAKHVNGVEGRVVGELGVGEKHRWTETKVYRRRPKGEKNKGTLGELATTTASKTTVMDNGNMSKNNKIRGVNTHESIHFDKINHHNNQVDENGVVESEKMVSIPFSADNANMKQIQPETTMVAISNKDLSYARMDSATPIPVDQSVTNGALRPPSSASDSKVKINLSSTAKPELRELKRKFETELYSVRKTVKKIDGSREVVVPEFFHPVVNSSVILNGSRNNGFATRIYSGTRSLDHVPDKPNIRPFNQLRVSVIENGHGMFDSIEREKRTPKANQFYRNSEFLLANDKFPPAESNKKSKSNGKKSSGGEFGFGVSSKVYKSCSILLEKLMKHKHGWVFNAPVDVMGLGLHDYFLIIKNPMDLGTVKAKLIKFWYKSPMEFAEDVRLTFHNAMLYNPRGHDVHIMAETLLKIFEGKWPDIEVKYLRELRMAVEPDMGYPTPTSRINNPFQPPALPPLETRVFNRSESMPHPVNPKPRTLTPTPSFRTPALKKPKAKDVNKRDMTYDEKQKLSTNLQSLPPEKLDGVIQIIKKRSTALSQNDDEIEVDIDSVDTETLWDLDRFVSNYKKSLSKIRRKAELANQMRADVRQAAEKIAIPQPMPPKESAAGYGNATLSIPAHRNDPAANAGGSSTSSSSSSSGSSSSDSDSDSSSEESDGGHSPGT